jgi:hypothetical protein
MAVVNKSSSDLGTGADSNAPLNENSRWNSDSALAYESWFVQKGSSWMFEAPYRVVCRPSHTSVVVQDMDPYGSER